MNVLYIFLSLSLFVLFSVIDIHHLLCVFETIKNEKMNSNIRRSKVRPFSLEIKTTRFCLPIVDIEICQIERLIDLFYIREVL